MLDTKLTDLFSKIKEKLMNPDFQIEYCTLGEVDGRKVVNISFNRTQAAIFADMLFKAVGVSQGSIKITFNVTPDAKPLATKIISSNDKVVN